MPGVLTSQAGAVSPISRRRSGLWIGVVICVYMACIAFSICAVIWVLTPEIFPNRVRGRAASIATLANWSTNAFSAFVFPWYVGDVRHAQRLLHLRRDLPGGDGVLLGNWCPKPKGKSLEEIERHWHARADQLVDRPL